MDLAKTEGAFQYKIISPKLVVVENRAAMRCLIPRCTSYNKSLTCPPNTPKSDETRALLSEYRAAIMIQVKGTEAEDGNTSEMLADYNWVYPASYVATTNFLWTSIPQQIGKTILSINTSPHKL